MKTTELSQGFQKVLQQVLKTELILIDLREWETQGSFLDGSVQGPVEHQSNKIKILG